MRVFAKRLVDARRADDAYRRLSHEGKARCLKIARKATKQPETICPNCRYDLSGSFGNDDSLRPCPECGNLVSPGAAIMVWCHERKVFVSHTYFTVFSGLFQALLAWVYITLAGMLGGSPAVERTFWIVWIGGVVLNAILLPYSAWKMKLTVNPDRHPLKAVMMSAVYTCGILGSTVPLFFMLPVGLDLLISLF